MGQRHGAAHRVILRTIGRPAARFLNPMPKGAKSASYPGFVEPCQTTLRNTPPDGAEWLHEIKYDGYRIQGHARASRAQLFTRRGYDWTARFGPLVNEIAELPVDEAILDGEVVAVDAKGRPDYAMLQADLAKRRSDRLVYYVFDL